MGREAGELGEAGRGDLAAAVGANLGRDGVLGGLLGGCRVHAAVAELGGDRGGVEPALRPAFGDQLGQGRVVDQADPFQPVERLGDGGRLEPATLQPLPQLGPGPGPGGEQPEGGGVGGIR